MSIQLLAAAAVLPLHAGGLTWLAYALLALPVLVLATGRFRSRPMPVWLAVALGYRRRGPRLASAERAGVPLLDILLHAAAITSFADRTGMSFGVLRSGLRWSVTLDATPGGTDLLGPPTAAALPPEALLWALRGRDITLHTARLVVHQAGSQGDLPPDARRRRTWVTLSIDPRHCPAAVEARGGGVTGALRALTTQAARLTVRSADLGVRLVPLDVEGLRAAVALCGDAPPPARWQVSAPSGYAETWRFWRSGDRAHVCYWVKRWPTALSTDDLLDVLADAAADSVTVVTEIRHPGTHLPTVRTLVRLAYRSDGWETAHRQALAQAARAGFLLVPLTGQQALGMRATLPTGLSA